MEKQKLRSEIDKKYKWDLSSMYESDSLCEKDMIEVEKLLNEFKKHEGTILNSAHTLKQALDDYYEIDMLIEKVYVYAMCKSTTDYSDKESQQLFLKAKNLYGKYSVALSFFLPEILKGSYEKIEKFYIEEPNLMTYQLPLKKTFKEKKHSLNQEMEELFSNFGVISSNFKSSSDFIRDEVMTFEPIIDENGNKLELTSQNYSEFMKNENRQIRKQAFENLVDTYKKFNNPLFCNYIGHIKFRAVDAKKRNYKNVLDVDLTDLDLPKSVLDSLVSAANNNVNVYQKELQIRKDILNLEELMPYDLSIALVNDETDYTFEQAKDLILDSFKVYGKEYNEMLETIFNNNWIDVFPSKGKSTMWYQNSSYLTNPVVFANYFSKYYDVTSLAHELGHAVHSAFAIKNNPYHLYCESLFIAEVASLTNEMVLGKSLLNKLTDKKKKLEILETMISVFSSNFFGGVKGYEFEYEAHKLVDEDKAITPEVLNQIWSTINEKYNGNIVCGDNPYGWSRIPHFFTDYYYYKYATGVAIAMYLSDKILYGNETDIEKYINFLKVGGSLEPVEALRVAGVDIVNGNVFNEAIQSYSRLLDEYKKIYNS